LHISYCRALASSKGILELKSEGFQQFTPSVIFNFCVQDKNSRNLSKFMPLVQALSLWVLENMKFHLATQNAMENWFDSLGGGVGTLLHVTKWRTKVCVLVWHQSSLPISQLHRTTTSKLLASTPRALISELAISAGQPGPNAVLDGGVVSCRQPQASASPCSTTDNSLALGVPWIHCLAVLGTCQKQCHWQDNRMSCDVFLLPQMLQASQV
jgi:hypothetical protein